MPTAHEAAERRLRQHLWPDALVESLDRLAKDGHRAVLVGGTVRDALLERPAHDVYDVATDRLPEEVTRAFSRVEPLGIAHGTVLILERDLRIECTTFRREGAYLDARHPERVEFTRELEQDLARRDLTVNAMAFEVRAGRLSDPFGGVEDLARRSLRAVGDPVARFLEDALRPVRLARLAATLEMDPDPATAAAMSSARERVRQLAVERVRVEFEKLMTAPRPSVGWNLLRASGLLEVWMPELTRCYGVVQNRFHAWDVWDHSLYTCDAAPADKPVVRWAALLHDLGKVDTRAERDGDFTFYQHQVVGAELADRLLLRLRFPNQMREDIVLLVREHMFDYRPQWSDAALRRWLRKIGVDHVADLFDLRIADVIGNGLKTGFPSQLEVMRERIEELMRHDQALHLGDLEVDGRDVMRVLGIGPGPRVGLELEALLEEVLENPERNRRQRLLERLEGRRSESAPPATSGDAGA
ncbi:MAG TPA: HDIG domain-containing protein [Candidatus Sulfotelmatobacter sp.]|nr:HDIG domain-containing protein [Candidatus Sulfotelmatobacter sp.]